MKTRTLLTFVPPTTAALLLLAVSCNLTNRSAQSWSLPRPVSIVGEGEWGDGYPLWPGWQSVSTDGSEAGLLLRDGDVFGGEVLTVYHTQDGQALALTSDNWSLRLAGNVVSVSLENDTEGRKWLEQASAHDLAGIRLLTLPRKLDAGLLPTLKKLAAANPGVALASQSNAVLQQVLPLSRPQVLMMGDGNPQPGLRAMLADQPQIATLVVSGEEPGSLDFLPSLHGLRRLTITGWKVERTGPLPSGLSGLRAISVVGSTMKDLSPLNAAPVELEELSLQADNLTDVHALTRWPGLKALLVGAGNEPFGLPELAALKELQWVSLPQGTTQEQFAAFVAAHRNLRILQLTGCEKVTDLAPLRDLKKLEGLVIVEKLDQRLLGALRDLKSLRFVGLDHEFFKESPEQVAAIRKALPDALVVPVSGLCLGSGWILLLIPAIAGLRLMRRRHATADARHA